MSVLQPPVDPEMLEMLASLQEAGEPDLVVELVTLFLRDTRARIGQLGGRPFDTTQAGRVAHAVKGSAGTLGATGLQGIARELERAAHRGDTADELALLVDAVAAEYARVEHHLRRILAARACAA